MVTETTKVEDDQFTVTLTREQLVAVICACAVEARSNRWLAAGSTAPDYWLDQARLYEHLITDNGPLGRPQWVPA